MFGNTLPLLKNGVCGMQLMRMIPLSLQALFNMDGDMFVSPCGMDPGEDL